MATRKCHYRLLSFWDVCRGILCGLTNCFQIRFIIRTLILLRCTNLERHTISDWAVYTVSNHCASEHAVNYSSVVTPSVSNLCCMYIWQVSILFSYNSNLYNIIWHPKDLGQHKYAILFISYLWLFLIVKADVFLLTDGLLGCQVFPVMPQHDLLIV